LLQSAQLFNQQIRAHWKIKNSLHWVLDVAFNEDQSRKRAGHAAQNYTVLNRIARNLLKNEKTSKRSVKGKRLKAGWDNDYRVSVLKI
jgi:predicted transposase YbfD/YdcC